MTEKEQAIKKALLAIRAGSDGNFTVSYLVTALANEYKIRTTPRTVRRVIGLLTREWREAIAIPRSR